MFLQCLQHSALKDLHQKNSKIWSDNMATVAEEGALAKAQLEAAQILA